MKIVGPNRQQVQSLGRHSVGNTGFEGEAQLARTIGDVGQSLALQTSELMTHRQLQNAGLAAQEAQTQFDDHMINMMEGKPYFTVDNLPAEVVTSSMRARPNGHVMRAEVEPALYKKHMESSLRDISKSIDLAGARADWETRARTNGLKHYSALQARAQTEIKSQFFAEQKAQFSQTVNEAQSIGDWNRAVEIAEGMYGTESQRQMHIDVAKQGREVFSYTDSMRRAIDEEGNVDQSVVKEIEAHIAFLEQDMDVYEEAGGEFNVEENAAMLHKLRDYHSDLTNIEESKNKRFEQQLDYDIDTVIANASDSMKTNVADMLAVYQRLQNWNAANDDDKHGKMLKLEDAINLASARDGLVGMSRVGRDAALNTKPQNYREEKLLNDLRAVNEDMNNKENTDAMQAWTDAGFFGVDGLPPVNWGDSISISNRLVAFERAQANYGNRIGQGPLTTSEAEQVTQMLEGMGPKQQLGFLGQVTNSVGLESSIFFKQLASEGNAGSMSIAGVHIAHGDTISAEKIMRGREVKKINDRWNDDQIKDQIELRIAEDIPNIFQNIPKKQETVKDTVIDAYLGIKRASGDFTKFDKEAYNQALQIATGGTFDHGKFTLPNPKFGMAPDTMPNWIRDTSWEYIKETSGSPIHNIQFITSDVSGETIRMGDTLNVEEFWSAVQKGEYGLQTSTDTNEYVVIYPNGDAVQSSEGIFTIRYDATAEKAKKSTYVHPRAAAAQKRKEDRAKAKVLPTTDDDEIESTQVKKRGRY